MNVAKILLQKDSDIDAQGKNDVTPLHLACHYDHPNVANMILEKGASPHLAFQNGHTPLHIAARKNQMDIASTLLEHGADPNAQSKAGFTPLQLSAQKGHYDMTNLLIEHGADPNHKAKNGLTALHLCAQEDSIRVASVLVKNGANVESATESGYRPIHVASHFGNISMIRFLLKHNAQIDVRTKQNYTPLHQAAQQGHAHVVSALLEENASHTAKTTDDLTPLNIAQKLGYISVMEVLKGLSYDSKTPDNKTWEEKYKVIAPESLHETCFMSDSDDEGVSDGLTNEQPYRYLTVDLMKSLRDDSLPIDVTRDDPVHRQLSKEEKQEFTQSSNYCPPENFDSTDGINLGLNYRSFFVSFLVDARGGTMKGCRYSGIRIIVPPRRATMPIRVTCRLVKLSKVPNPPALMEGESLATRIIEMGPVGASFLGPVLIDIPHFASVHGKEREIIILRSENGETWKEHDNSYENDESLFNTAYDTQMSASHCGRIVRIITTEFPQYFAIVTRIKQEVHVIGADGGILISSVANHVQAVFPPGALTKKIKVGLQAHVIPTELTAKLLGNCVAVSPVITIEPRRRKFHKPITLTIPVPQAASKGMINQYEGETPTLRLLCSIAGGTSEAQWEDVTGSTPLTFLNNRVSFTTTVSARFWLMDCRNISEVPKMATELYKESLFVPFITNFVIYTKRFDVVEATLRILCMTGGKDGLHTLEQQEEFLEIVKSRDVEALDGKEIFLEFSGNLVPVTKSGQQLKFTFKAFRQNRLSFHVKVKDPLLDPVARMMFMRDPRVAKGEPAQQPICVLNIVLPEVAVQKSQSRSKLKELDSEFMNKMDLYKTTYMQDYGEKRDMPKLTSSNEQEKIDDIVEKKNKDAAIVESLAKNVACSLESVDASNIDNANDHKDMSPTLEHQTYSEKLRFWEEVSKKRDSYQRSESEISRASQLTINETDSEFAQNVVSEDNDVILNDSETMEELDVPDISECTVAEKAHYFEEQIQKEIETAVKVPFTKTPGGQDSKKGKQNNIVDQTSILETEGADLKSIKHDKNVESQKLEKKSMVSQIPKKISSPEENKKENEKIKSEQMEDKTIRKKSMDLGEPEVKIIEQKSEVRVETKIPASKIPTKVKTDSTSSKMDNKEITNKSDTVNLIKKEVESKISGIPIPSSKNNKLELDMSPKDIDDNKKKSKIPVQVVSSTTKIVDNNQGKEAVITVTETKITETISQHYEKQTTETKSQSQTVIKTVTHPKDSFESIEEIKITSEPESTITSKVNLEETKKVAEKEIISSQISKDDTKILKHEERDHESSEKLSESKVTTEKKDETLEDKITRSEKSDKNGVKEILIEVADGKQTISAAASQGMKILKDEIRSERSEDSEKIVVQETEAKMLKEREVDTAITMEKSESQADEKSDIDTFNLDKSFEDELKAAVVREESREEYSNRSDINVYLPKESTENISREESFAEEIPEELGNHNVNIADKNEVRNIAESLIQSIENEIIKRSESSQGIKLDFDYEKNDTEKEMESNDFDERLADNLNQKLTSLMKDQGMEDFEQGIIGHDKNSTHQSSSISEDITKEEEEDLSFDKKETEESVLLSSSQVKVLDKDVTISLSSMSDQIELEESLESEKYQLERHLSGLPDEIKVAEEYIEHPQELVMPIKYETSEDSGARVLQILEPGVNIFETAQSFMPEAEDQEYVPDDEEHSLDEKYMKDLEFNKLHESEAMEHLDKLDKICNIEKPVRSRLQSSVSEPSVVREKKEIDHEFFESKRAEKLKVKELEIPQITWSIGDEKIGIVETLEPSEAFDKELDELQSSLNKQKDLISPHEEIKQEDSAKDLEKEIVFSADTAIEDVEGDIEVRLSPDLSDTMIEPEDNKIEAQLVENKLDISCQELVATLQREYETKTPTDEPIPLTPRRMSDSIETLDFPKVNEQTISEPVRESTLESTPSQLDSSKIEDQSIPEPPPSAVDEKVESETIKKEEKVQVDKKETSPLQKSPKKDKQNESFTESTFKSYKESFSHITQSFDDSKRHPEKLVDIKEHLSYGASIDSASMKLKKEDLSNVDLSSKYAITVLDQVVKREIAEVKESLEAAKQDLIEELNEQNQPVQIKDSPSEFQFKLQPESIPNDLPFLYKAPSVEQMTEQEEQYSQLPTDTQKRDDEQEEDSFTDSNVLSSDIKVDIQDVEVSLDTSSAPVPASRSSSDIENKEDGSSSLSIPPQPVPRRRQKPTRISKAIYSEREGESSSGESSNYQSCDYESGSRPSSSDVEALHSAAGILSGTASEYETALMSIEHTTSKPTSQDYQSAVSTLSSHESMKSLNSLSSGHLGSIDSTSELTETLVASESDKEDEINENLDMALEGVDQREKSISPESDVEQDELMVDDNIAGTIPTKMKRSSEMLFQHISDDTESFVVPEGFDGFTEEDSKQQSGKTISSLVVNRDDDDKTSITDVISDQIAVEESSSSPEVKLNSIEAQLTGDDVSELKMTTLSAEDAEALLLSKRSVLQQASMSTSSTSGMSVETVIERERPDRHSPDSDSFELVDKPDIIDDFVVIEEVGREAKEFDAEGKSISIKVTHHTTIKKFDRDIENLITDKKQEGEPSSKPISTTEVFDFESEESPPQASNEDQYSQQSYSDDETEAKKWMEMQFQADARAYELECERGPLEDIKEEEITDFEAGSSRFGSLGSHKGSIGSSGSMKGSYGSTEFDVLAGKKMFAKSIEHDNISMNSLQEFENLESAVIGADGTRRFQCGSQDSVNNGSLPRRYISGRSGHGDDISVSSLKDFEGLEKACREAHMIELRAKEEEDLLEHESPENRYRLENLTKPKPVEPSTSFNPSTSGSDDYEKRIMEIDEIIRIAQANVEKFDRQDDTTEDISQIEITDAEKVETAATNLMSTASEIAQITRETNIMETSTDSLELENNTEKQNNLMYKSSDSLELKTTIDLPSLSYSDSLNNVRESQVADKFNSARRISSDSLEAPVLDHPETVQSETTESSSNGSQSNDKITKNGKAASIATTKS
ncbi:ankyrin-2-like isoform X1 [Chelonus insularis]|uniref:ankyrin-2-like isoform X1 n=1 Tax=Chelonus insularis TaxID=460826 RepID=UPI00158C7C6B|nr:ankyrin-2-like isoform X1 [Chelonus insularis]